jgi:hypothetical protein
MADGLDITDIRIIAQATEVAMAPHLELRQKDPQRAVAVNGLIAQAIGDALPTIKHLLEYPEDINAPVVACGPSR